MHRRGSLSRHFVHASPDGPVLFAFCRLRGDFLNFPLAGIEAISGFEDRFEPGLEKRCLSGQTVEKGHR